MGGNDADKRGWMAMTVESILGFGYDTQRLLDIACDLHKGGDLIDRGRSSP